MHPLREMLVNGFNNKLEKFDKSIFSKVLSINPKLSAPPNKYPKFPICEKPVYALPM